jgi:hypothetical protein
MRLEAAAANTSDNKQCSVCALWLFDLTTREERRLINEAQPVAPWVINVK